jgi:hypothetical protein
MSAVSYEFSVGLTPRGWLISAFRFNVKFVDGNLALEKAPQRALMTCRLMRVSRC